MGIDRFTQLLTDQSTIKDVILFPAMRNEDSNTETTEESQLVGLENSKVIIGQVKAIKDHPNADTLKIYQVQINQKQTLDIISSCKNIKENNVVAVALIGSLVHAPENGILKIKSTKMRGIESPAMMCSPLELGVDDKHDCVYILPDNLSEFVGESVNKHFNK